jgi:hypothetical protein
MCTMYMYVQILVGSRYKIMEALCMVDPNQLEKITNG